MKRKKGRPPISKSERRSVVVNYRVSKAEYRKLAALAKRRGLSVSEYLRTRIQKETN
jgi:hypothetical protein